MERRTNAAGNSRQRASVEEDDGSDDLKLGKVLDFMRVLWSVDHSLQSASKRMNAELGVTGLQRMVIRLLGRFPESTAGFLAGILHVHPSTLTGVVDKLARSGVIARRTDPNDARRAKLTLTSKGKSIDAVKTGTVEASIRRALNAFSEDDLTTVKNVLQAIERELERD